MFETYVRDRITDLRLKKGVSAKIAIPAPSARSLSTTLPEF